MLPALRAGDCLVVQRRRAVRPVPGGWELASDNPAVAGLGLTHGPAAVEAVVRWRYWPWPPTGLAGSVPGPTSPP